MPLSSPITRIRLPSPGKGASDPGIISWSDELSPRDPATAAAEAAATTTTVPSAISSPREELRPVAEVSKTVAAVSGGRIIEGAQQEQAAAGASRWGVSGGASQTRRGAVSSTSSSGGVLRTLEAANVLQTDVEEVRHIIETLASEIRRCEGVVVGGERRLEC